MMLALAWLAPWLLGFGACLAAVGRPRDHGTWCLLLGLGWLVGMLLLGWLLLPLQALVSPHESVPTLALPILGAGALLTAAGWRWRHAPPLPAAVATPGLMRLLVAALVLLLAWHGWLIFEEARLRPLFPWDAWLAWSVKPKTWFALDQWVPFIGFGQWLTATGSAHTIATPAYPELIGRLETWFASGAGCWCDPAFTVLWPALWLAMLVGGYGLLRRLGCNLVTSALALYALGSLPLVGTHAALAGYADLWVAVTFAFALLCWLHWQRGRHPGSLVLALLLALSLPAIKVEGSVWMLLWFAILALGLLPGKWRRHSVLGVIAVLLLMALAVGLAGIGIPVPGIGWMHIDGSELQISNMAGFALGWQNVVGPVFESLLVLPNWNLLFWVALPILAWRWRRVRRSTGLGLMTLCLGGGAAFLFVLFFLTGAGAWASDYTSFNRLTLHLVPALVFLLALLLTPAATPPARPTPHDTAPEPARLPPPA